MNEFNDTFHRLLDAWNRHQHLRSSGAPCADLASSRAQLDSLRVEVARRRSGLWSL